ncbi:flagellar hook-basal body complex protein FliE [Croceicoccus mobilis]|uniref:Flagellar hook-basal body complex protein FliE n=1 Tax=Croceicoccus mobilis TaxID=1703339 RepID=A0A916YWJ9_9SPHN|nr:flagellar hook-basal body complex protein FliE [Croceicoccus mobilis]GGD64332.1 flagellar hook-basal body complex protein FliE [Croceicoccus mobilis]
MSSINPTGADVRSIIALRQQIIDRSQALRDVHASQKAESTQSAGTPGFAETLNNSLQDVNAVQVKAEDIGNAYQRGEVTDVAKVMLARQEAGVAFEATLQVRNKLLSAYQDIMRMGV